MHGQTNGDESGVIQFARVAKSSEANEGDQLDKAGQTLLQLVQNAAGVAEENSRRALSAAQNLSHQLRAAEDRIAELEAEVAAYQERADRAEIAFGHVAKPAQAGKAKSSDAENLRDTRSRV